MDEAGHVLSLVEGLSPWVYLRILGWRGWNQP